MVAVIVKDASAEEIAAPVLAVQERQKQGFVPYTADDEKLTENLMQR